MLPIKQILPVDQQKLLALYGKLSDADQQALLKFGRFLATQDQSPAENSNLEQAPATRLDIPRPKNETVIKAIRRLSQTYPMLDGKDVFDKTSLLMSGHLLQGRSAVSVIDELEQFFELRYAAFKSSEQK